MKWISIGENCLPDGILQRFRLKPFSSPFSHVRCNIDHVHQADLEDFATLLDPGRMYRAKAFDLRVVRTTAYGCDGTLFEPSVAGDFEFTHHDVLADPRAIDSYRRKIARWLEMRRRDRAAVFLYSHRYREEARIDAVCERVEAFLKSFGREGCTAYAVVLDQRIADGEPRSAELRFAGERVLHATAVTEKVWGGTDQNLFWARTDDDILRFLLARSATAIAESLSRAG